jgi:hypothetical protein
MLGVPTRRTHGHDLCHIRMLQELLQQVLVVLEWAQVDRVWVGQAWVEQAQDSQGDMAQVVTALEDIHPTIHIAISKLHHGIQVTGLGSMGTTGMLQCNRQCPINSSSTLQRSNRERKN